MMAPRAVMVAAPHAPVRVSVPVVHAVVLKNPALPHPALGPGGALSSMNPTDRAMLLAQALKKGALGG